MKVCVHHIRQFSSVSSGHLQWQPGNRKRLAIRNHKTGSSCTNTIDWTWTLKCREQFLILIQDT